MTAVPGCHALEMKVLLEGLLIPASAVRLAEGVNTKSEAFVTIPFNFQAMFLRPRTNVAVFYRYKDVPDDRDPNRPMPFLLLFSGEVVGLNYTKSEGGRVVTLSCVSYSNQLDYNMLFFSGFDLAELRQASASHLSSGGAGEVVPTRAGSSILTRLAGGDDSVLPSYAHELMKSILDGKNSPYISKSKLIATGMFDPGPENRTKLAVISNDLIDMFIKTSAGGEMLGSGLGAFVSNMISGHLSTTTGVSLWAHFVRLFSVLLMDYVENQRVTHPSFLFKPIFYYGAPPRCNVIFPYQYHSISFSHAFMQAPTRMLYNIGSQVVPTGSVDPSKRVPEPPVQISPSELDRAIKETAGRGVPHHESYLFYTAEEAEKGIVAMYSAENELDSMWFHQLAKNSESREGFIQRWMDFKFYQSKLKARQLVLSDMSFSPHLMCGWPCAVLDNQLIYLGYLHKVVHTLDASGHASTQVGISYVRNVLEAAPGTPIWITEMVGAEQTARDYSFYKIGEAVYKKILGCDSIKRSAEDIEKTKRRKAPDDIFDREFLFNPDLIGTMTPFDIRANCYKAIYPEVTKETHELHYKIYESLLTTLLEYKSEPKRVEFAEAFTYRAHSTFAEYVKYYGEYVEADERAVSEEGLSDLRVRKYNEDYPQKTDVQGRTFPAKFLRTGVQEIVMCYRNNLSPVMRDFVMFDPEFTAPGDRPVKSPERG